MNGTSSNNGTEFKSQDDTVRTTAALVCFSVLLITGVIGNSLIILQVIINKFMRNPTFIVICGLAAADFIMVSVRITKEITDVSGKTINTPILCKLQLFLLQVSAYSAAYHLVLLSVIRYFFLVHPFQAEKYLTNRNMVKCITGLWIMILVIVSPLLITANQKIVKYQNLEYSSCLPNPQSPTGLRDYLICFSVFSYILPLTMLIIFHSIKAKTVITAMKTITVKEKRKVSYMVVLVVLLFACLLFPVHCKNMFMLSGYNPSTGLMKDLDVLFRVMAYTNNCINPFVYGIMSTAFRTGIKNCFHCKNPVGVI